MSLLGIVKSVMDSNGWPSVTSSVSASLDVNMRQAFALANKAVKDVSFKKNWPILAREWAFITNPGIAEYELPPDFHHLLSPSAVDADQYYQLKGNSTPIQWYRQSLKGAIEWSKGFRIDPFTKTFKVAPLPSSQQHLVYMYISKYIVYDAENMPVERYSQDTDTAIVEEELVEQNLAWRWRQKKGLDFTAEMAEATSTLKTRFAQQLAGGELPIGGYRYNELWPLTNGYFDVNRPIGV